MKKVAAIFASLTGNTELILDKVEKYLEGIEVERYEMEIVEADEIAGYDAYFIGAYTWGEGELPFEATGFLEKVEHLNFKDKIIGCFGSGDHAYQFYCEAVHELERIFTKKGASVKEKLLIELSPDSAEQIEECKKFAKAMETHILKEEENHANVN